MIKTPKFFILIIHNNTYVHKKYDNIIYILFYKNSSQVGDNTAVIIAIELSMLYHATIFYRSLNHIICSANHIREIAIIFHLRQSYMRIF